MVPSRFRCLNTIIAHEASLGPLWTRPCAGRHNSKLRIAAGAAGRRPGRGLELMESKGLLSERNDGGLSPRSGAGTGGGGDAADGDRGGGEGGAASVMLDGDEAGMHGRGGLLAAGGKRGRGGAGGGAGGSSSHHDMGGGGSGRISS